MGMKYLSSGSHKRSEISRDIVIKAQQKSDFHNRPKELLHNTLATELTIEKGVSHHSLIKAAIMHRIPFRSIERLTRCETEPNPIKYAAI